MVSNLMFLVLQVIELNIWTVRAQNNITENKRNSSGPIPSLYEVKDPEKLIGFDPKSIWPKYCDEGRYYYPNFQSNGRRISEEKCLDYIWKSKIEEEKLNRLDCWFKVYIVSGGRNADFGEIPHMAAVGWISAKNNRSLIFKCGASIISEKFLLTAAHCSQVPINDNTVSDFKPKIVRLGCTSKLVPFLVDNESDIIDMPIKRLIVHEQYRSPKQYYDIALIEVNSTIPFNDYIRPACLWGKLDINPGVAGSISGWGVYDVANNKFATHLQIAQVNFYDSTLCNELYGNRRNRNWNGIAENQLCAGHLAGAIDSCKGDSGGPLQVPIRLNQTWPMYYLVGVTAFGFGCARRRSPGIYTRVASFIDWIEENVWNNND